MTHRRGVSDVLEILRGGNARFAAGHSAHPNQSAARRAETLGGQHPIAAVITCSDSRVSPELIFDQGIGDLFVIRTAGVVIDETALASVEYAAQHLHVPLILVMGHERCGAVEAALKNEHPHGHLRVIMEALAPAINQTAGKGGDRNESAVRAHVRLQVAALRASQPLLAPLCESGRLTIAGAYYSLRSGLVEVNLS